MKRTLLLIFFVSIFFVPCTVFAKNIKQISFPDAQIKFFVDQTEWQESNIDDEYYDNSWKNNCGIVTIKKYDAYSELSEEDLEQMTREQFNYQNLFTSDKSGELVFNEWKEMYNADSWNYITYKMKFINFEGVKKENAINVFYDLYITINNGYMIVFQYSYTPSEEDKLCSIDYRSIVSSSESTIPVESLVDNNSDEFSSFLTVIIGLIITAIAYMLYPFVRVVLMKKKYDIHNVKRMALFNSIIVGFMFLILTVLLNKNATWSAGPAFLYYIINSSIWKSKNNDENLEQTENAKKNKRVSNNNAFEKNARKIKENNKKEGNKSKSSLQLDRKYSDLKKLKELLDEGIISKRDYKKEKKKVLNK